MRTAIPQNPPPTATLEKPQAGTTQQELSGFPNARKYIIRRCFISLLLFLIIAGSILATVLAIRNTVGRIKQDGQAAHTMTAPPTMSITPSFSEPIRTVSEVSTTTQVKTQPTTIIESTTIIKTPTLVHATTPGKTFLIIASKTLKQVGTQSSTLLQVSKHAETSRPVTVLAATDIEIVTITQTTTTTIQDHLTLARY
jgi:hypothetical protein